MMMMMMIILIIIKCKISNNLFSFNLYLFNLGYVFFIRKNDNKLSSMTDQFFQSLYNTEKSDVTWSGGFAGDRIRDDTYESWQPERHGNEGSNCRLLQWQRDSPKSDRSCVESFEKLFSAEIFQVSLAKTSSTKQKPLSADSGSKNCNLIYSATF